MKSSSWAVISRRVLVDGQFKSGIVHGDGPWITRFEDVEVSNLTAAIDQLPPGTEVTDVKDLVVTPAFVNAHTHVAMSFFRGIPRASTHTTNMIEDQFFRLEQQLTAADVEAFARLGAIENMLNGVGLVWDHYYHGEAIARACRAVGLPAVVAPTLQDLSGPGSDDWEQALAASLSLNSQSWAEAQIYSALGPHASDTVSATLWGKIGDVAESQQLPIHTHLCQTVDEVQRCQRAHEMSPIQWLAQLGMWKRRASWLLVHGIYIPDEDYQQLDPRRHVLGLCPYSQMQFATIAPVWKWERAGLSWCVATDCVASNDSMNVQKELRLVAGLPGLAPSFGAEMEAFRGGVHASATSGTGLDVDPGWADRHFLETVWSVPGSIHPRFKAGCIEDGHLANLLFWDPDHPTLWPGSDLRCFATTDSIPAIDGLMVAGQVVGHGPGWRQAFLAKLAYNEIAEEAHRRLESLRRRTGV